VGNGNGFFEIAEVSEELEGGDWNDVAYCLNDEDAVLFAAAPDLLDLCEQSLRALHEDDFPSLRQSLREVIERAKAKGGVRDE
jgi:hypothetical protein